MKNIAKSIFVLLGVIAVSCSTDDVQDRPVIEGVTAPVLSAPQDGATYTLSQDNASAQAERFVWSAADYNGVVAVNYTVEMDTAGGDFSEPYVLGGTSGDLHLAVSVVDLNNAVIAMGAVPNEASTFDVRVTSDASGFSPMTSNVVTITVAPYEYVNPVLPLLAVPGNHQGWSPNTAPLLAASSIGGTDFEGFVWLDGEYKFVAPDGSGNFDWGNTDWGDDGTFTGVLLEEGEVNCEATTAGYYQVWVNTGNLTYGTNLTEWGLIGSATPGSWDNSTPMTYDNVSGTWSVTVDLVGGQEYKFRANNAWDINLGDSGNDGSLEYGGDNIPLAESGNYTVTLDLSQPRAYTYTITQN